MIFQLQDHCIQQEKYKRLFSRMLHGLYELEVLEEEAILKWAEEVMAERGEEEGEKRARELVMGSEKFLEWLRNASEEEEE